MSDKPTVEAAEAANARRREEDRRMVEHIRELAKQYPLNLVMPKAPDPKMEEYKRYMEKVILAKFGLYLDDHGHIQQAQRTLCHNTLGPEEKVVDYEKLEFRIAEHILGIDFATNPDRTVAQELVRVPRDKAKELLYGLCYGAGPRHIHDALEPNKNGDVFPPLPHFKPGDPIGVSKPFNDIIDRVNELTELFVLGQTYCTKHKDISMGCSVKPAPCPACDQEEKERLKKNAKENPFISHESIEEMRKELTSTRYIREYMGMWPPLEEEPKQFPGETEGAFFRRKKEWIRDQREDRLGRYKAEPIPARKEDDLPSVIAMGMKEVEKHKLMQEAAQKDFGSPYRKTSREPSVMEKAILGSGRGHSPGTEMFIEAQRKARPKKLVDQAIKQNEEALATKELEKVTEGVNWKPGHCKICGHANGCHHPRVQTPESTEKLYEKACQHLFLTRVQGAIATELGATMADGMTCAIYACRECHKIIARIPMGSLPK